MFMEQMNGNDNLSNILTCLIARSRIRIKRGKQKHYHLLFLKKCVCLDRMGQAEEEQENAY